MVIWLWFKSKTLCDISILMYNLPHCLLEWFFSLVVKNPNSLSTTLICLFLILYNSRMKIVCTHQPLHNLQLFLVIVLHQNHVTFSNTIIILVNVHFWVLLAYFNCNAILFTLILFLTCIWQKDTRLIWLKRGKMNHHSHLVYVAQSQSMYFAYRKNCFVLFLP